ncbi:mitochondrial 54S ribosomal protein YmL41 [Mycoemilia scoparia]|uniref:Large ribosomal subunit protein uL23m n=1 Tax=Mycoemilia scoparia TaxID=417184 RepID=A0A9W8DP11_9FUNG|nr:mitochondrial 54S ribosomal protein YmL41 [Mycoemilia scoparia]
MSLVPRFGNKKVFFPNLIFKIIRDPKLGPNQAAFRVPLNVNKFDIRDYLSHLYKVTVTDVRTVIFPGKKTLDVRTGQRTRTSRIKKAIVTTVEEFKYPPKPDVDADFGGKESSYESERRRKKLLGFRIRPSKEQKELAKEIKQKMLQTHEEESGSKAKASGNKSS